MPTDDAVQKQAEEWKARGNEAFEKGDVDGAVKAYSQGVVACDRLLGGGGAPVPVPVSALKATLLSNRAMCHLRGMKFQPAIDDCTTALDMADSENRGGGNPDFSLDAKLRGKLLFRRAKARFLLSNLKGESSPEADALRQDAARDLLQVVQHDPNNAEANKLLMAVRAQHKQLEASSSKARNTPVTKTLDGLEKRENVQHNLKVLLGLLENDPSNASMEMGRTGGVQLLFELAMSASNDNAAKDATAAAAKDVESNNKIAVFAVQCLSRAGSYPAFVQKHLKDPSVQKRILDLISCAEVPDLVVSALALYDRIILHLDRDDPDQDIRGDTGLDYACLMQTCNAALSRASDRTVIRAVLDVLTVFTAGKERDASIRAALAAADNSNSIADPLLPAPVTEAEVRAMNPKETAAYRARKYDKRTRDEAWAYERGILFAQQCMRPLLRAANACQDHVVRREITVVVGRILAGIGQDDGSDDKIKEIVKPFLQDESQEQHEEGLGVVIEEVYNEDGEEESKKPAAKEEETAASLETMMERAIITCALLISKKEVGAWALGPGWLDSVSDLEVMIDSGDSRAMCLASEVVSAAATLESAGPMITGLIKGGYMEKLITSDDRDIRSGAASAVAKVGLADKSSGTDEGEVMGLLQGACDLLEDRGDNEKPVDDKKGGAKLRHFSSFATSSVERAIEMITYLVANTFVKEELAAGFQAPGASQTALERLVDVSSLPNAGESLSGFGLATIFQHLAVTNLQLRKEMFEGKEVTMEQYDEMQRMGKTEEEKEMMDLERDQDTQDLCNERIRKMASANVPRAMVSLMEGASDHTLEQLVLAMNRMAGEPSVRGVMIQQGVLSACIKVEKNEGPTETDTMVKVIRHSRHCIAKLLITTNPTLLTSAQRLGSVRPLLHLIRDIKGSDLQHFEALLAITNIAGSGEDAKNRIVSEKGIPALHFAMFSDHELVKRAATEAMCNLVPHEKMMEHLAVAENLKLWMAFASDYEENYECARAAAGCLAMATQDKSIAEVLATLDKFGSQTKSLLECGRLEVMHRVLYMVLNLMMHGGSCRDRCVDEGLPGFCEAYVANFYSGEGMGDLEFSEEERALLPVTVDVAKKIIAAADSS